MVNILGILKRKFISSHLKKVGARPPFFQDIGGKFIMMDMTGTESKYMLRNVLTGDFGHTMPNDMKEGDKMTNSTDRVPNRLIIEKSPYLLQHAHNPVDWYPWGEEALSKAKNEDKPIFLSIGYS